MCSLEHYMPKLNFPLFDPLTRIDNACRRASNIMLTAPDPPRENEMVLREIQEIREALEAFKRGSGSRRNDGISGQPNAGVRWLGGSGPENLMRAALARTAVLSLGWLVGFHEIEIVVFVPVMVPYPVAQVEPGTGLVAALGRQIQAHVALTSSSDPRP